MRRLILNIFLLLITLAILNCSNTNLGGSEAGNPPSTIRTVKGNVSSTEPNTTNATNFLVNAVGDTCLADRMIAIDSSGTESETTVNESCNFTINLTVNKAYELNFFLNDEFIAFMIFQNKANAIITPVMILSASEIDMDLGQLTCNNFQCTPENEPASQNDQDMDGIFDFDDDDDDDDGELDDAERDCDLDGFIDDFDEAFDENFDCSDDGGTIADVLDVYPWDGDAYIDLTQEVFVLFSCVIDSNTVNSSTFVISDQSSNLISCDYQIDIEGDGISCLHDGDPFVFDEIYTATIDGIQCDDATPIPLVSWSWSTGANL